MRENFPVFNRIRFDDGCADSLLLINIFIVRNKVGYQALLYGAINLEKVTEINEIERVLNKLITLLNEDNQKNWAEWFLKAKNLLREDIESSISKILGAYGGMGSFNDTYLTKITRKNENFSSLRTQLWELAMEVKTEFRKK
tara:strand:+ start:145 stop:570 length:426 start_codon:yes stop_codon:yes gene_type:complete